MNLNGIEYEVGDLTLIEIIEYLDKIDKLKGKELIKYMNVYCSKILNNKISPEDIMNLKSKDVKKLYSVLNEIVYLKYEEEEEKK